jgi:hypothetical protein
LLFIKVLGPIIEIHGDSHENLDPAWGSIPVVAAMVSVTPAARRLNKLAKQHGPTAAASG